MKVSSIIFSFNFKNCGIDPGETRNVPPTLTILDDFCAADDFKEIVTAPADPASIEGTGATSFDNFDFTIFKFPGQEKGNSLKTKYFWINIISVTFSCTVSIFLKDAADAPDAATYCPTDGRRKREVSGKAKKEVSVSATVEIKGKCLKTIKSS